MELPLDIISSVTGGITIAILLWMIRWFQQTMKDTLAENHRMTSETLEENTRVTQLIAQAAVRLLDREDPAAARALASAIYKEDRDTDADE